MKLIDFKASALVIASVLVSAALVAAGCSPDTPENPELPAEPEMPENPEEPEVPDNPENPDAPEIQDDPDDLVYPDDGTRIRLTLFENTNLDIPYRIPAFAACGDGTLIAVGDFRYGKGDIGAGRIDLHSRISTNNGRSWKPEKVIVQGSGKAGHDCAFGDASLVCDRETGEVLMMAVCGSVGYFGSTRGNTIGSAEFRSNDRGRTWTEWKDRTEDIYSMFDGSSTPLAGCFITSGRIFQSRQIKVGTHYRIYLALCARPGGNRVIYSDDFGQTWKPLGGADALPITDGNEAKCEELPDGRVILSSRTASGRYFNIYSYSNKTTAAGSWGTAAKSGSSNYGCSTTDSFGTNGEILVLPVLEQGTGTELYIALQSIPLGGGGVNRSNVAIYYKTLNPDPSQITPQSFANYWTNSSTSSPFRVSETKSAYSTMDLQSDGNIGFFFEETLIGSGYNLVYTSISVEELTSNQFKLNRDKAFQ
ncbi:MAG: sialidase family protein [Candidatus Cryptobacteroides sp.]